MLILATRTLTLSYTLTFVSIKSKIPYWHFQTDTLLATTTSFLDSAYAFNAWLLLWNRQDSIFNKDYLSTHSRNSPLPLSVSCFTT